MMILLVTTSIVVERLLLQECNWMTETREIGAEKTALQNHMTVTQIVKLISRADINRLHANINTKDKDEDKDNG